MTMIVQGGRRQGLMNIGRTAGPNKKKGGIGKGGGGSGAQGGQPAYVHLETQTLGADVTTITFSSFPSQYRHFILEGMIHLNTGTDEPEARLNGDSSGVYEGERWIAESANGATAENGTTSVRIGHIAATADYFHPIRAVFIAPLGTTFNKGWLSMSAYDGGSGIGNTGVAIYRGGRRNTAAMTSLTLVLPNGNSFQAGSVLSLYGLRS